MPEAHLKTKLRLTYAADGSEQVRVLQAALSEVYTHEIYIECYSN